MNPVLNQRWTLVSDQYSISWGWNERCLWQWVQTSLRWWSCCDDPVADSPVVSISSDGEINGSGALEVESSLMSSMWAVISPHNNINPSSLHVFELEFYILCTCNGVCKLFVLNAKWNETQVDKKKKQIHYILLILKSLLKNKLNY